MASKGIKPSKGWYLLPIIIFLLGPLLSAFFIADIISTPRQSITLIIPGTAFIYVPKTGHYTLWAEVSSNYPPEKVRQDLEHAQINFFNQDTGRRGTFTTKLDWQQKRDGLIRYTLGGLEFHDAGHYKVISTTHSPTLYRIKLNAPGFFKIISDLAVAFFLNIITLLSAILSAIIILVKRSEARRRMEQPEKQQEPTTPTAPSSQATTWAMVCHLSGFLGFLFPLGNIIAPLLIWGFKRQEYPYLDDQGKEAVNFQISVSIYYILSLLLILLIVGLFLLPLLAAFHIIAMIIASIEAAHGKTFRYPLTIRFLK